MAFVMSLLSVLVAGFAFVGYMISNKKLMSFSDDVDDGDFVEEHDVVTSR